MAKKMKFVLNRAGVRQLMKSSEMISTLKSFAPMVGNGETDMHIGSTRANVAVKKEGSQ